VAELVDALGWGPSPVNPGGSSSLLSDTNNPKGTTPRGCCSFRDRKRELQPERNRSSECTLRRNWCEVRASGGVMIGVVDVSDD